MLNQKQKGEKMKTQLSTLEDVDIRNIWENESIDFTPWLAQADNIDHIGQAIGMDLTVEEKEKSVGPYRADIFCKDEDENPVLIENQFGKNAYPKRILMADLPEGALLIPNPINNIPGFFVDQHYFMPGFPEMAWPMIDWVIENNLLKTEKTTKFEDHSIWLDDVSESSLIDLMNQTQLKFNNIKIYSLPKMHPKKMLELGVKGEHGYVFEALNFIKDNLNSMNISWRDL